MPGIQKVDWGVDTGHHSGRLIEETESKICKVCSLMRNTSNIKVRSSEKFYSRPGQSEVIGNEAQPPTTLRPYLEEFPSRPARVTVISRQNFQPITEMEDKIESLVLELFDIKVLKFGSFKLKSSIISPIYVDLRIVVSYPKVMDSLTNLLVSIIKNSCTEKFQHICGVPYTALPLATLISSKRGTPMLIRRKEAKDYGTKKIIEGVYNEGDSCIIIEDVITSGSSIIETVEDLEKAGLKVSCAVVVLDREQGALKNLQDRGIKVHVLTSLSKLLKILLKHNKITAGTVEEVEKFIAENKPPIVDGKPQAGIGTAKDRLKMSFSERAKVAKNEFCKKIFQIMETKKTLLCLAADVTKTSELLRLASQVGPHICIFKTHFDALEDFSKESFQELMRIAKNLNFLIMEDRKFSDIGNTAYLQYNQIKLWSDLVTVHSLAGESILSALKSCIQGDSGKGCFLVAELSCQGHLMSGDYAQETSKMAENHLDFVVGLVCQSPSIIKSPHLIQLTPGVKIEKGSDSLGQNYNDPEYVVLEKGADIAVVGRGIILSPDPERAAVLYKEKLWNAYQKRIG